METYIVHFPDSRARHALDALPTILHELSFPRWIYFEYPFSRRMSRFPTPFSCGAHFERDPISGTLFRIVC